jgi:UDP-N-acetylmuramoyl-tripeptide--D-alanyl-D-alanine ligase
VIPADSPHFERLRGQALAQGAQVLSFGEAAHADVRLLDAVPTANGGSLVTAALGDRHLCYSVAEPGSHWIANSLAVMAAVHAAGGDLGAAGLALAEMGGLKGRGARTRVAVPGGHALFIDESYNANPASMRATLAQLGQTPATRRIAVLGSMKELGDFAPAFHAQLALARELGKVTAKPLGKPAAFAHCSNPGEAIAALEQFGLAGGDAVLVKGSNSVGLGRVVAHFTAREG